MAAIALRARSYGAVSSGHSDERLWAEHSDERTRRREAAQDGREAAARHPEFFQAFRLLRGLSLHLRTHLSRLVEAQRATRGEEICDAEKGGAALVLVLEGEARIDAGESLLAQMRVREGQTFGEEMLTGRPAPLGVLRADSLVCKVAVLRASALAAFEEAHPENAKHLALQLRAHRAWHYGDETLSPQEVRAAAATLRTAARNGDRVTIRSLVRSSGEGILDVGDPEGVQSAALHVAVMCRQTDAVLALLTLGASPDVRDASSSTPLHSAALAGNEAGVRMLLQHNASVNVSCSFLRTPLHVAAQEGAEGVVALLLPAGALLDAQDRRLDTPLHLAVRHRKEEVVKQLLHASASVAYKNEGGMTPFHEARRCQERERCAANSEEGRARRSITTMLHEVHVREKSVHGLPPESKDRSYLPLPSERMGGEGGGAASGGYGVVAERAEEKWALPLVSPRLL